MHFVFLFHPFSRSILDVNSYQLFFLFPVIFLTAFSGLQANDNEGISAANRELNRSLRTVDSSHRLPTQEDMMQEPDEVEIEVVEPGVALKNDLPDQKSSKMIEVPKKKHRWWFN